VIDESIVQLVTVLSPIVLTLVVWLTGQQAKRSADKAAGAVQRVETTLAVSDAQTTHKLNEIHVLVNSRLTEALAKIDRLETRLQIETGEAPTGEPLRAREDLP